MKTPEQRIEELEKQCAMWKREALARDPSFSVKVEELEKQNAAMREACESALAGVWDGHYSGKGVTKEYAQAVDAEVKRAISTTATQDYIHKRELDPTKELLRKIAQNYYPPETAHYHLQKERRRLEKLTQGHE